MRKRALTICFVSAIILAAVILVSIQTKAIEQCQVDTGAEADIERANELIRVSGLRLSKGASSQIGEAGALATPQQNPTPAKATGTKQEAQQPTAITPQNIALLQKVADGDTASLTDEQLTTVNNILSENKNSEFLGVSAQSLSVPVGMTINQRENIKAQIDSSPDLQKALKDANYLNELQKKVDKKEMTQEDFDDIKEQIKNMQELAKGVKSPYAGQLEIARRKAVRIDREQRIKYQYDKMKNVLEYIGRNDVGNQLQDWLNNIPAVRDFSFDPKDPSDWEHWGLSAKTAEAFSNFFGYGVSGYEHAICDARHPARPEQVIQDYPGHYIGSGDLPNLGTGMLVLLARRTEYQNANWKDAQGNTIDEKWFPEIQADGTVKPKGYLYKISWTVSNYIRQNQYDAMENYERDKLGLFENGTVKYKIIIRGKNGTQDISYEWNEKILDPLPLASADSQTYSFYDKAKLTEVEIIFLRNNEGEAFEYNGVDSSKKAAVTAQELSMQVPEGFDYFPASEISSAGITYTRSDGTAITSDSTECDLPVQLCPS